MSLAIATRTVIQRRRQAQFLWGSLRAALQARRSPGYLGGALRITRGPVFWTLTQWQDGAAMNAFRTSGVHGLLMPKMAGWASQASTVGWKVERDPSWDETYEQMARSARRVELAEPDRWHREGQMEPPSRRGLTLPIPRRLTPPRAMVRGGRA
jgi:hypothetical protein